ncbi:MAG: helix-turn-helix domain-containing protein, partial [Planctomycetota bacterium]
VERAAILARDEVVRPHDLPVEVREPAPMNATREGYLIPRDASLEDAERIVIEGALSRAGGDKDEAARLLGIGARTIYRRLKSWKKRS